MGVDTVISVVKRQGLHIVSTLCHECCRNARRAQRFQDLGDRSLAGGGLASARGLCRSNWRRRCLFIVCVCVRVCVHSVCVDLQTRLIACCCDSVAHSAAWCSKPIFPLQLRRQPHLVKRGLGIWRGCDNNRPVTYSTPDQSHVGTATNSLTCPAPPTDVRGCSCHRGNACAAEGPRNTARATCTGSCGCWIGLESNGAATLVWSDGTALDYADWCAGRTFSMNPHVTSSNPGT